jgi:Uma2 family endonuclease
MLLKSNKIPRTALELFELLPLGLNCELINDTIFISPSPLFAHQDLCDELTSLIRTFVKTTDLGKCVSSPIDVYLSDTNVFQPDMIYIAKENLHIVKQGKVKGAPDLVIEILSQSNKKSDLVTKKAVYEKTGVKEYFVVNPLNKEVIAFYLKNGKFEKAAAVKSKVKSKLLQTTFTF